MSWLTELFANLGNLDLRECLAQAEQRINDMEVEREDLKEQVRDLTAENEQLRKELIAQVTESEFVELGGVLWKKEIDGCHVPCCPVCKTALAAIPLWAPDSFTCRLCKFKAPFYPQEVSSIVAQLPK